MSVKDVHQFSGTLPDFAGWFSSAVPVRLEEHDLLNGLGNDDHPHYHNDFRGDTRYTQRGQNLADVADAAQSRLNLGVGDDLIDGRLVTSHAHPTFYDECHDRDLDHFELLTSGTGSNFLQAVNGLAWMQSRQTNGVWTSSTGAGDVSGDAAMTRGVNRGWWLEDGVRFFFRVGCSHSGLTNFLWGYADDPAMGTEPTNGIYCEVDTGALGTNTIRLTTSNASTRTKTDTEVSFDRRLWFDIEIRWVDSEVRLYIDGALKAVNTANLPTGAGRDCKPFLQSEWAESGSTDRLLHCDWLGFAVPNTRATYGHIQ